jgi:hypothetical protein
MCKLYFAIIFIIFPISLFSQKFEGGFFGGLSASQIDGDAYSGYNKVGITAGAYFTREINRNLNWKTELRFIQKGAYKKNTENDPTLFKTTLQYVEVPIILQYFYNKKVFLEAGIIPEILLSNKEETENGVTPFNEISHPFNRFVIEGTAGVGYFLTNHIAAGFRYSYSLLPISDFALGTLYRAKRGSDNNVLSFTLYYHFN